MRYLIDGYNLAYAMSLLTPGAQPPHRLELVRNALLLHIATGHGAGASEVTVVFDAQRGKRSLGQQTYQGVRVLFATGQSADDLIEDILQREKGAARSLTVVSDDRRLRESARRHGCASLGCLDYLEALALPRSPEPRPKEEPLKPGAESKADEGHWLKEFGDIDSDPKLRDDLDMRFPERP
jgi:predicted RNA-binding protein with PIN domain